MLNDENIEENIFINEENIFIKIVNNFINFFVEEIDDKQDLIEEINDEKEISLRCLKCNQRLEKTDYNDVDGRFFCKCINSKCEFYGILRQINEKIKEE